MNTFILDFLFEILNLEFVHELVVLWMVALRNYGYMLFNFFKHLLLHFAYDWLPWSKILELKQIFIWLEGRILVHVLVTLSWFMQTLHQIYLNFFAVKWISVFWLINLITLFYLFNADVRQFQRVNFLAILFVYFF